MKRRARAPLSRLDPKRLLRSFLALAALGVGLGVWHRFAGAETKTRIESCTLAVIDIVRENSATPAEVVFLLDLVADAMPMMRGPGAPAPDPAASEKFHYAGAPKSPRKLTRLANIGYEAAYDEERRSPAWVAYSAWPAKFPDSPRPSGFAPDARTRSRVTPDAYSHSGYDRGHMAPNRAISLDHGPAAQKETFLMSNITPQFHNVNAGVWERMEARIQDRLTRRFAEVRVICGPVYDDLKRPRLLKQGVRVPDGFFLIITDRDEDSLELRAQGLLIPNDGSLAENAEPEDFLRPIRDIEKETGLDFLSALPAESQDVLEKEKPAKAW